MEVPLSPKGPNGETLSERVEVTGLSGPSDLKAQLWRLHSGLRALVINDSPIALRDDALTVDLLSACPILTDLELTKDRLVAVPQTVLYVALPLLMRVVLGNLHSLP